MCACLFLWLSVWLFVRYVTNLSNCFNVFTHFVVLCNYLYMCSCVNVFMIVINYLFVCVVSLIRLCVDLVNQLFSYLLIYLGNQVFVCFIHVGVESFIYLLVCVRFVVRHFVLYVGIVLFMYVCILLLFTQCVICSFFELVVNFIIYIFMHCINDLFVYLYI